MTALRWFLLIVRFLVELAMFAALGIGGWMLGVESGPWPLSPVLAFALPVGAMILWGTLLSPSRVLDPPLALRLLLEAVLFGGAGWLLHLGGETTLALWLVGVWFVDRLLLAVVGEDPAGLREKPVRERPAPPTSAAP